MNTVLHLICRSAIMENDGVTTMTSLSDLLVDVPTGIDDQYPFDMIHIGYDARGNAVVYVGNDPLPPLNPVEG